MYCFWWFFLVYNNQYERNINIFEVKVSPIFIFSIWEEVTKSCTAQLVRPPPLRTIDNFTKIIIVMSKTFHRSMYKLRQNFHGDVKWVLIKKLTKLLSGWQLDNGHVDVLYALYGRKHVNKTNRSMWFPQL